MVTPHAEGEHPVGDRNIPSADAEGYVMSTSAVAPFSTAHPTMTVGML